MELVNVVYHSPCLDGFCSCLGVFLCHQSVRFYPYHPGSEVALEPAEVTYFLDTIATEEIFQAAVSISGRVVVIDHHWEVPALISSWSSSPTVHTVHSYTHSACILAWNYFKSQRSPLTASDSTDTEVEALLLYVQDRDLYANVLPGCEEVIAGLNEV